MPLSKETIDLILTSLNQDLPKDTFYISIYLKTTGMNKRDIKQRIKAISEDLIHQKISKIKAPNNEYFSYLSSIENEIDNLEKINEGIAIFAKANLNEHILNTDKAVGNIDIMSVNLPFSPDEEIYIGETYSLIQLFKTYQSTFKAIAVVLNLDEYSMYKAENNNITLISSIQANVSMEPSKGLGDYRFENRKMNSKKDTIIESSKDLKKVLSLENPEFIVVIYSPSFSKSEVEDKFQIEVLQKNPGVKAVFSKGCFKGGGDLLKLVQYLILGEKEKIYQEKIDQALKTKKRFAERPTDIINNIELNNAETLFIKENVVFNKNILSSTYASFTKAIKKISNPQDLITWMVKEVWEKAGNIFILPENQLKSQMLLKLRYK